MTISTDLTREAPADDILPTIAIYTDGACSNNGQSNPQGGWGAVLMNSQGRRLKIAGKLQGDTITNNRAELTAVIKALEALKRPVLVELTTDSEYVQKGATEWLSGWKRRGWKTASKAPVKNADLWRQLDALLQTYTVRFHWVRGHNGHPENELADSLAVAGAGGASVREYERIKAAPDRP
ncbi:ribonuclease HI [Chromohalobacter moromii]|uniref:Ribonuclease H n=1 Tax=Chromohalobacter moromii TaxID=2860329 RepID=A0A9X3AYF4_9GAMM|nr:ribonuclease HI [Chromohalobacter moromii]MCK2047060.1 ribonuclease HI [Chromohalobacter moromii]MCT8506637.1 ribonuclease HI [Chromohalobacter moromii]